MSEQIGQSHGGSLRGSCQSSFDDRGARRRAAITARSSFTHHTQRRVRSPGNWSQLAGNCATNHAPLPSKLAVLLVHQW